MPLVVALLASSEGGIEGGVARVDDHHPHPVLLNLGTHPVAERQQAELGGGVDGQSGERAGGAVADHVDHPAAGGRQVGDEGSGEEEGADHVHLHLVHHLGLRLPGGLSKHQHGRIVDQAVEPVTCQQGAHLLQQICPACTAGNIKGKHSDAFHLVQDCPTFTLFQAGGKHAHSQFGAVESKTVTIS